MKVAHHSDTTLPPVTVAAAVTAVGSTTHVRLGKSTFVPRPHTSFGTQVVPTFVVPPRHSNSRSLLAHSCTRKNIAKFEIAAAATRALPAQSDTGDPSGPGGPVWEDMIVRHEEATHVFLNRKQKFI